MPRDPESWAHQEWLGYVQPVGLVVSTPALAAAQAHVNRNIAADHQRFLASLPRTDDDEPIPEIRDFAEFTQTVLGWRGGDLEVVSPGDPKYASLDVVLPEYHETLSPTHVVREQDPKDASRPWMMLVKVLPAGTALDEVATEDDRHWQATPHAKFERLLRETQVPLGLLVNGSSIRLVYAPRGESSGYATFGVAEMMQVAGRPIFAALHMLLCEDRLFSLGEKQRLPAILAESRKYQNTVSTKLAEQVLAALYELLRGFQAADEQTRSELLRQILAEDPNHVYGGLLTVLMRLVFLLYAEDRGLVSTDPVYSNYYSVSGLYERLRADNGRFPDTMDQRYGGWAQLLTLFRLIHEGGSHRGLQIPAREGYLFDPDRYNFLEGRPGKLRRRDVDGETAVPRVSDGVLFRVLDNLLMLDGERLSYRTLDVEQIGSVYETMMGFDLEVAQGRSISIKPKKSHGAPTTINLEALLAQKPGDRNKWLKAQSDQEVTGQAATALKDAKTVEDLLAALDRKIARKVTPNAVARGTMVLQPSDERRRSGSHYTPRSLTEPIVRTTLEPVLRQLCGGSRESGVGSSKNAADRIVPRPQGVAVGDVAHQGVLSPDKSLSEGGAVRSDVADSARGGLDSGQHRRGERPREHGGIHSVPTHRAGKPEGAGNPSDSLQRSGDLLDDSNRASSEDDRRPRSNAESADSQPATEAGGVGDRKGGVGNGESGVEDDLGTSSSLIPDSLFPTPHATCPTPEQILNLKVCDPAMGSGAFLVEACRQLGDALVKAWHFHRCLPKLPPDEDEVLHARRLIAQRCLYGVDRNPMAVDLSKLSLWLATLAKDHPFTFLDHSLRCGDSLVGLTRDQIAAFHWQPAAQQDFLSKELRKRIDRATEYRRKILAARDDVPYAELRRCLELADDALSIVRLVGDACVAAFFEGDNAKSRERARIELAEYVETYLSPKSRIEDREPIAATVKKLRHHVVPFHWEVELPEVFSTSCNDATTTGFDVFVGNPPFLGGTRISSSLGELYRDYLLEMHAASHGNSDLVAYFFRRAFVLLRQGGTLGLIATNTISQGDTRSTGLRWICSTGGQIYSAERRYRWPGQAAVVVSIVHIAKHPLPKSIATIAHLDGTPVQLITAYLFHAGTSENAAALSANAALSYSGAKVYGQGFIFADDDPSCNPLSEMRDLCQHDPQNGDRIFPYIGGEELNDSPTQTPVRYVIGFDEMSETEASAWPDLMALVEKRVRPERAKLGSNRDAQIRKRNWWLWGRFTPGLIQATRALPRMLVCSQTSKYLSFAFIKSNIVVSHKIIALAFDSQNAFSVVQSRVHQEWAYFMGSTMKDDPVYTPSDCFATFPFPLGALQDSSLAQCGGAYYDHRATLMVRNNEGLTKTYNRFHDPYERSPDILKLRELHAAMDRAVLEAYGWDDLAAKATCEFLLDYEDDEDDEEEPTGRRTRKKPWRYRWPDDFRDEVLAHLLDLNQKRAEEERRAAAANDDQPKKKPRGRKAAKPDSDQQSFPGM